MGRVAIIGTGISGLGAAYLLARRQEITVYEKARHIGGHTRTLTVDYDGTAIPVDTGFIVFNERNYPLFTRLLAGLRVRSRPTEMSFSVR